MPAWLVNTRRAPSRHCRKVYGNTTASMHKMSTLPPPTTLGLRGTNLSLGWVQGGLDQVVWMPRFFSLSSNTDSLSSDTAVRRRGGLHWPVSVPVTRSRPPPSTSFTSYRNKSTRKKGGAAGDGGDAVGEQRGVAGGESGSGETAQEARSNARVKGATSLVTIDSPPPTPSRRFSLGACKMCLVGENPTCSVPPL